MAPPPVINIPMYVQNMGLFNKNPFGGGGILCSRKGGPLKGGGVILHFGWGCHWQGGGDGRVSQYFQFFHDEL